MPVEPVPMGLPGPDGSDRTGAGGSRAAGREDGERKGILASGGAYGLGFASAGLLIAAAVVAGLITVKRRRRKTA